MVAPGQRQRSAGTRTSYLVFGLIALPALGLLLSLIPARREPDAAAADARR